jgi:hypothetical protein
MKSLLREKSMPGIPADLVAAIEARTLLVPPRWWETNRFRSRLLPALVGVATAAGALWLSKVQQNPKPEGAIPMAAYPQVNHTSMHAFLLPTESSDTEKGESREN